MPNNRAHGILVLIEVTQVRLLDLRTVELRRLRPTSTQGFLNVKWTLSANPYVKDSQKEASILHKPKAV